MQPQHLAQRHCRILTAHDAQVVQRQVRDQLPGAPLVQPRPQGGGGRRQAFGRGGGRFGIGDAQAGLAAAEGQLLGQVAVAAGGVDGQHAIGRRVWLERLVAQQQPGFGARER